MRRLRASIVPVLLLAMAISSAIQTPGVEGQAIQVTLAGKIPVDMDRIIDLEWSPDGSMLAVLGLDLSRENWSLVILDPQGQEITSLRGPGVVATSIAWSPDSMHIAIGDGHMLRIYTARGEPWYSMLLDSPIVNLSWKGDFIVAGSLGEIYVVKPGGDVVWNTTIGLRDVLVDSSIDTLWAGISNELVNTTVYIFKVADGSLVSKVEVPGAIVGLDTDPRGDVAAVATRGVDNDRTNAITIIDSAGDKAGYMEVKEPLTSISWSPDGAMIAAAIGSGFLILSLDEGVVWSSGGLGGSLAGLDWGSRWMLATGINGAGGPVILLFMVEPGGQGGDTVTTTVTETDTVTLTLTREGTTVTTTETVTRTITTTETSTVTSERTITSTATQTLTSTTLRTVISMTTIPYTETLTETVTTTSTSTVTVTTGESQAGVSIQALLLSLIILGIGIIVSLWLRRG